jgi:hypothetical protein
MLDKNFKMFLKLKNKNGNGKFGGSWLCEWLGGWLNSFQIYCIPQTVWYGPQTLVYGQQTSKFQLTNFCLFLSANAAQEREKKRKKLCCPQVF